MPGARRYRAGPTREPGGLLQREGVVEESPHIAVCAWDLDSGRACQIKGEAEVLRAGSIYDDTVAWVRETKPDTLTKAAVVLHVSHVYVCPSGPDRGRDVARP